MGFPINFTWPSANVTSAVLFRQKLSSRWWFFRRSGFSSRMWLKISVTVIRFCVSVPVLSEQTTLIQPTVSQAIILRTSAFCFDILIILMARDTATMVGSPSGTAATISTMLVINASDTVSREAVPFDQKNDQLDRNTTAAARSRES